MRPPAVGKLEPGAWDAITDVPGVRVGHETIVHGDGPLLRGTGPVRTGVTVVRPRPGPGATEPVFAGVHALNGNGELTGSHWLVESGLLTSAIGLTNSHSVGVVRDELVAIEAEAFDDPGNRWFLPVVAETWDGVLNDIDGHHVHPGHVRAAYAAASNGPVEQGNVGGGTGMICHGFKGGIGSASRKVRAGGDWTVGVLVQANHGRREHLRVGSTPVGRIVDPSVVPLPSGSAPGDEGRGSVVVVIATDAPLLPHQCRRAAQRAGLGIARTGGLGEHSSGDLFLAFSTANAGLPPDLNEVPAPDIYTVDVLHNQHITAIFDAVVEATEQAVVNALHHAATMVGRDGRTAWAIGGDRLRSILSPLPG